MLITILASCTLVGCSFAAEPETNRADGNVACSLTGEVRANNLAVASSYFRSSELSEHFDQFSVALQASTSNPAYEYELFVLEPCETAVGKIRQIENAGASAELEISINQRRHLWYEEFEQESVSPLADPEL